MKSQSNSSSMRSFFIHIYGQKSETLVQYQVPVSVAAPFCNRLFHEVLDSPDNDKPLRELWFGLEHHVDRKFLRSPRPLGPTSLYGQRYDVSSEKEPVIQMLSDAVVHSFVVRLYDYDKELYQGEYSVDDIFLNGANFLLHSGLERGTIPADRGPYYYEVIPSEYAVRSVSKEVLPEDAYKVEGVFRLPPRSVDEPRIRFTPVLEPPLPVRVPESFNIMESHGKGTSQVGQIFIPEHLYAELRHNLALSQKNEEGGYALGNVYRLPTTAEKEDAPNFRWLVEVTDLLMAEYTIGTPITLLFTGDTWSNVSKRRDRDFSNRKLIGWFHTHVFPATDTFGLSGLDQDMHAWYLPKPWQIAILLNIEDNAERTVRCYQRGTNGDLVETPFEVFRSAKS